jgi:transcriptional regulator with AAA-type ATPase domain
LPLTPLPRSLLRALIQAWPGNVRELAMRSSV